MTYNNNNKQRLKPVFFIFLNLLSGPLLAQTQFEESAVNAEPDILALDIEDLLNVEVTSAGKKEQSLSDTAAAVFVITQNDIRQSGVTNIPEALRLAPGIEVARIDANKWAISSRGFNNRFANKLLVMIDGRTVYTPSFSGVYWEVQDTVLEDIEQIEVIRGPGATLWGANAVNGVINIITKNAIDTQGTLITLGTGTHEKAFSTLRYGTQLNDTTHGKVYIKGAKRDNFKLLQGGNANDDWTSYQGGGRLDSQVTFNDQFTLQGDFYQGKISNTDEFPSLTPPYIIKSDKNTRTSGANILARWQHTKSLTSDYILQAWYDYTSRDESFSKVSHRILDLDFQHRFSIQDHHDIVWGLGYRFIDGDFDLAPEATLIPEDATEHLYNVFIQDEITLLPNQLWLTLGSKFEKNDYTDWEVQPSARIFWNAHARHKLWSAVSHAVRTPSRYEYNSSILVATQAPDSSNNPTPFPLAFYLEGNQSIRSEEVTSYELGYRVIPDQSLAIDMTIFYSEYDRLTDFSIGNAALDNNIISIPVTLNNKQSGYSSGFEIASHWQSSSWWDWDLAYNYFNQTLNSPNGDDLTLNSPHQNLSLRSNMQLRDDLQMNLWLKYTDDFETRLENKIMTVDSYTTLDARIAWQANKKLEVSLVGQNLLDSEHLEYIQDGTAEATEIERGVYIKLLWQF